MTPVGRSAGISDTNVKDIPRSSPPEAVDSNISTDFWRGLCACSAHSSCAVLTHVNEGFVGDGCWGKRLCTEMVPLRRHVIVPELSTRPPFLQASAWPTKKC
jgi:hypothetical protein